MHLERRNDGYRVRYAIADLAAFVEPGGALDRAVWERGVTYYSPDGAVPLHPPVLATGAASLLPDQVRPAIVWTLDLDADGALLETDVARARVRSRAKLDYAGVQARIARVPAAARRSAACASSARSIAAASASRCPSRRWSTARASSTAPRCRSRATTRRSPCSPGWRPRS